MEKITIICGSNNCRNEINRDKPYLDILMKTTGLYLRDMHSMKLIFCSKKCILYYMDSVWEKNNTKVSVSLLARYNQQKQKVMSKLI